MIKNKFFLLFLVLVSSFVISACGPKTTPPASPPSLSEETDSDSSFTGSVKDLLSMGKNLKCTWAFSNDQSQMSGTVYVSGQKSRTDMTVNAPQAQNLNTHFVSDGQVAFSWTDGQPQGYKFEVNPDDQNTPDTDNQQYQDWQNDYEYKCSPWVVDNSLFQTPSTVEFVDINEQLKQTQKQLQSVCDSLPSPQKEECQQGLVQP